MICRWCLCRFRFHSIKCCVCDSDPGRQLPGSDRSSDDGQDTWRGRRGTRKNGGASTQQTYSTQSMETIFVYFSNSTKGLTPSHGLKQSPTQRESNICKGTFCGIVVLMNKDLFNIYQYSLVSLWPRQIQSGAVIMRSSIKRFCTPHNSDWSRTCIRDKNHKRHPIARPHGRAMGCLLW